MYPIGRRITIGRGLVPGFDDPPRLMVAIVGDVCEAGLNRPPAAVM